MVCVCCCCCCCCCCFISLHGIYLKISLSEVFWKDNWTNNHYSIIWINFGVLIPQNSKLKEEQLLHIKTLLKQVKEKDKEVEQAVDVGHEQVEKALLEKFEVMKREEQDLQGKNTFLWYLWENYKANTQVS